MRNFRRVTIQHIGDCVLSVHTDMMYYSNIYHVCNEFNISKSLYYRKCIFSILTISHHFSMLTRHIELNQFLENRAINQDTLLVKAFRQVSSVT